MKKKRTKVYDLLPSRLIKNIEGKIHSIGRLDYNSQGLLLLTNNTKIKNYMENPTSRIERVYKVKVQGIVEEKHKIKILRGISIEKKSYDVLSLQMLSKTRTYTWMKITLIRGKNQHIRKIFFKLGMSVNKLIRIQYGPYKLTNLKIGEVKILNSKKMKL